MVTFDIDQLKAVCPYQNCRVQLQVDGHEFRIIWHWKGDGGKFHEYSYAIKHSESQFQIDNLGMSYVMEGCKRAMQQI